MANPGVAYACLTCGAPTTETTMVVGGAPRENAIAAGVVFCGTRCLSAWNSKAAFSPCCLRCNTSFDPSDGKPGRPRAYCGDACRRAQEADYARALRLLGSNELPRRRGERAADWAAQAEEALTAARELERLLVRVQGRRPDGAPGIGVDDAALPARVKADAHLISAIKAMHAAAMELHGECVHQQAVAYRREEDLAGISANMSLVQRAAQAREAEAQWRKDLVAKSLGADGVA